MRGWDRIDWKNLAIVLVVIFIANWLTWKFLVGALRNIAAGL